MLSSGPMKVSVVGQAGGQINIFNDQEPEMFKGGPVMQVEKEEAEMRMMGMVQRAERWNVQRQASK